MDAFTVGLTLIFVAFSSVVGLLSGLIVYFLTKFEEEVSWIRLIIIVFFLVGFFILCVYIPVSWGYALMNYGKTEDQQYQQINLNFICEGVNCSINNTTEFKISCPKCQVCVEPAPCPTIKYVNYTKWPPISVVEAFGWK